MKVGLTYDLRDDYLAMGYGELETAEFDAPFTIDSIEKTLRGLGYETERIGHARELMKRLTAGKKWDLVFNIAEGQYGMGREALVPALLEAFRIPYTFSDPLVLALTLHKGMTKRVVRDLGLPTPEFVVVEAAADLEGINLPYPLFAKPVAEGTGKGVTAASKINNDGELRAVCAGLLKEFGQPVLVETFLPGREFTVGLTGTGSAARALGAMEVVLNEKAEAEVYSYVNKEECAERVEYRLVDDAMARETCRVALAAWVGLGCRDAGRIDLRADARGVVNFMEVNPLAGLRPGFSDLPILADMVGVNYSELLDRVMKSARARYGL